MSAVPATAPGTTPAPAEAGTAVITLALVSHTNVGKTTLARTLLGRDVGEVRDAAHVTQTAEGHVLLRSPEGDTLSLWDTPGFGDSERLVRRMRASSNPLGWFLSHFWDRWRDRAFWHSQQAVRSARERADVVLYLVSATEQPGAPYIAPELELLEWIGKPVIVLLNQLGAPRDAAAESAEVAQWTSQLDRWKRIAAVLPLDAFARCWVQEATLWSAVAHSLPAGLAAPMQRLQQAWWTRQSAVFDASMQALATSLAAAALARVPLTPTGGLREGWRQLGNMVRGRHGDDTALDRARARLARLLDEAVRDSTAELLALHGIEGEASGTVLDRVGTLVRIRQSIPEGRAAVAGGLLSGALGGLGADLAAGGLTLGAGMLAGALIGAIGAAGAARGFNVVHGAETDAVTLEAAALPLLVEAALLRYLAVAHYGRGRGEWAAGEAPAHWAPLVAEVTAAEAAGFVAAWQQRSAAPSDAPPSTASLPPTVDRLAAALKPLLARCMRMLLARLYPLARLPELDNRAP